MVPPPRQHEGRIVYRADNLLCREVDITPDRSFSARLNASTTGGFQRLQKHLRIGLIEVPSRLARHQ